MIGSYVRALRESRDEQGGGAVEYGLLVLGVATLISAVVMAFGSITHSLYMKPCTAAAQQPTMGIPAAACR